MTERQAIESTYFDTFSSYRRQNVKDETTKQTKQTETAVLADIPCALSKNTASSISFGGSTGEASAKYTLFHAPELDIQAGDKIVIITLQGQEFTCYAGKPFTYSSHAETSCYEEERT